MFMVKVSLKKEKKHAISWLEGAGDANDWCMKAYANSEDSDWVSIRAISPKLSLLTDNSKDVYEGSS